MLSAVHRAERVLARELFFDHERTRLLSLPNLCLGAGGAMGYLMLGTLRGMFAHVEDDGLRRAVQHRWICGLRGFSGVSVGALLVSCLACRAHVDDVIAVSRSVPVAKLMKMDLTRDVVSVMQGNQAGVFEGNALAFVAYTFMRKFGGDGKITFLDVQRRFGSDLRILAVRVCDSYPVVFSARTTPDMPVAKALCASMSIPGVFVPFIIDDVAYVDGGVRNQIGAGMFPVDQTFHVAPRHRREYVHGPKERVSVIKSVFRALVANYAEQIAMHMNTATARNNIVLVDSDTAADPSTAGGGLLSIDRKAMDEMLTHGELDLRSWLEARWITLIVALLTVRPHPRPDESLSGSNHGTRSASP